MRNNKLAGRERTFFEMGDREPPRLLGMYLMPIALGIGSEYESVFLLREERAFVERLRSFGPFELHIASGVANTLCGPMGFLLCWFPPIMPNCPYASYEVLVSPEPGHFSNSVVREAAQQTHIHLIILDENNETFDVVEFENVYG